MGFYNMNIIKGNLITEPCDILIHGCNCFLVFGKGVALQVKNKYPEAYKADLKTTKGDPSKLGKYSYAIIDNKIIINAYTQYHYGFNKVNVDYKAIKNVFNKVAFIIKKHNNEDMKIIYPKIGAGLAGGDWNIISKIIDKEFSGLNHYLVIL